MRALVIYESMYGNTRSVAEAIGDGLFERAEVTVMEVGTAPLAVPVDVGLLVVGGPTHAFGMSRASTREDAATHTSAPIVSSRIGVREWLDELARPEHRVAFASFDTHVDTPRIIKSAGSAAGPIGRHLAKLGCERVSSPEHFWVSDMLGPLREGELDRAREWGRALADTLATVPK